MKGVVSQNTRRRNRRLLPALVAAGLSWGCAVTFEGSANLWQRPRAELAEQAVERQGAWDRDLVALYCGDQAKAQAALEALGVPRQEAARRVLAALAAGLPTLNGGCKAEVR
jgi:hypothetical protein